MLTQISPHASHLVRLVAVLPILTVATLTGFLFWQGLAVVSAVPAGSLLGLVWQPLEQEQFGVVPALVGTLALTLPAVVLAVSIGVGAAVFVAEHERTVAGNVVELCVMVSSSVPSVVLGLVGVVWVTPITGLTLASGIVVLTIVLVPTFTLLCTAVLRQVPAALVDTARAHGLSDHLVVRLKLRHSRRHIAAAALFSLCRGLGEAISVAFVCGNVHLALPSVMAPVVTIGTAIAVEIREAQGLHRLALFGLAFLGTALIIVVSLVAQTLDGRRDA